MNEADERFLERLSADVAGLEGPRLRVEAIELAETPGRTRYQRGA